METQQIFDPPAGFDTLFGLVQRFSPTGQEAGAVSWLVSHMQSLGFTRVYRDPAGNAVGVMGNGPQQLILLGHIDTVPGEIPVRLEGDLLYGRGSVDAKGPLASFVDAVAAAGPVEGWQVLVIGAVDEEGDSAGARALLPDYHPDFVIAGEPSRWDRITLGYKGSAWSELTFRRPVAHTASQAETASEAALAAWETIRNWVTVFNQGREQLFDRLLPSLHGMSSGQDGFEAWASLRVGVRLPPVLAPQDWYRELMQLVGDAQVELLGYAIPAYLAEKNTPLVRAFLAGIRSIGGKPGFVLKSGTSDMNIVAPAWGCPTVAYGPGDSSLDHTPIEHISLEEYRRAVKVLQAVIERLTSPV